ncbi:hypothetical protein MPTK1_6g14160 [Marchantia polymorpha subsp. ruderalis]|uniref:Uncharacterized protein n=1 Tax=Marchantia polymorpha subsp. ruderalis TaxID=1480154 RepID=A0AAF6BRW3_MARPO|nr:hypothetical protein Mp_6g14160 [Marchantia polymorpha subsp. ruderalis]
MIQARWSLATGPIIMLGGVFAATTTASLLWEKYVQKSEKDTQNSSK